MRLKISKNCRPNSGYGNMLNGEAESSQTHHGEKSARQATWIFQKISYKGKNKRTEGIRDMRPINQVPWVDFVWILTSTKLKESLETIGNIQTLDIS